MLLRVLLAANSFDLFNVLGNHLGGLFVTNIKNHCFMRAHDNK